MLPTNEVRTVLAKHGKELSADEISKMLELQEMIANAIFESWLKNRNINETSR